MNLLMILCFSILVLQKTPLITKEFVSKLKSIATWEVEDYENSIFKGWTLEEAKNMLSKHYELPMADHQKSYNGSVIESQLPDNFDPRDKFGACIHPIRDQGKCGSCWAFGMSEVLSDRFCIAKKDVILSPQVLVSCDKDNNACNGGYLSHAFNYATNSGLVLDSCFPYVSANFYVPPCPTSCPGTGAWVTYKCAPGSVFEGQDNNFKMNELYTNGPIENCFQLYQDFFSYKSGIYYHTTGGLVGGHCTKTLGWGIDSGTGLHYWLVANSWGTLWGMNGFFKIKQADCGIDNWGYGCTPLIK